MTIRIWLFIFIIFYAALGAFLARDAWRHGDKGIIKWLVTLACSVIWPLPLIVGFALPSKPKSRTMTPQELMDLVVPPGLGIERQANGSFLVYPVGSRPFREDGIIYMNQNQVIHHVEAFLHQKGVN